MFKYSFLILIVISSACGNVKRLDTTAMKEQMNNSKIVKVSNEDIVIQADILGKSISKEVNTTNYKNCEVPLESNLGELEVFTLVELKGNKFKETKEQEMADAFAYGLEHNETLSGNVQKLTESTYLYVFPVNKNATINKACSKVVGFLYMSKQAVIKSILKK